jgi:hypothetical protein
MTQAPTDATTPADVVGVTVSILGSVALHAGRGSSPMPSILCDYGTEIVLTAELIAANKDRFGRWPLLEMLDDLDAQRAAFGRPIMARGPWPADQPRYQRGSPAWEQAHDEARAAAFQLVDEVARNERLAAIRAEFGSRGASTELQRYQR